MTLLEPAKHVVEMTVIDTKFHLDVFLEAIDGHCFWGFFEFLEEFVEIGVISYFVIVVGVAVGVVEVDESEFFAWVVVLYVLQDLLVATGDTLRVHIGPWTSLKTVSMSLQGYLVLPILLQQQISQMILIIDSLKDLPTSRIDQIHTGLHNWIIDKLRLSLSIDAACIGGQIIEVLGCGGEAHWINVY